MEYDDNGPSIPYHPANEPRDEYRFMFDKLCATCERVIPWQYYGQKAHMRWLLKMGWRHREDGALVCPVCADKL